MQILLSARIWDCATDQLEFVIAGVDLVVRLVI